MPTPDVDPERILSDLSGHHVRFVVIGGYAIELWDVAVAPTADIDITPESSPDNLRRLAEALNGLSAALRVSGSEPVRIPGGFTPELIAQMSVLNLATDFGPPSPPSKTWLAPRKPPVDPRTSAPFLPSGTT